MSKEAATSELALGGVLNVGINLSNMLLVTGREADGTPTGVAPEMAKELARRLGVEYRLHPIASAGETADAISSGDVAVGLIAIEAERAKTISFSDHYCEIEATYMVPEGSAIRTIEDVDQPGTRIAVSARAAYDLYLSRTLKHAELVRAKGLPAATKLFIDEKLDVLAGLRPALLRDVKSIPGARLLDGRYTTIEQAIGTQPKNTAAREFIETFVEDAKSSRLVANLIDRFDVTGKLVPAG